MNPNYIPHIALVLGILARIFLPYFLELVENPEMKFDARYLIGQLLSVGIVIITDVLSDSFWLQLSQMTFFAALATGYAIPSLGRLVHKGVDKYLKLREV